MSEIWLAKNRRRRLEQGHPWIFRSEIARIEGEPDTGDVVVVKNHQGFVLGQGFYHAKSQIAVRLIAYTDKQKIDERWLRDKVKAAWQYRKRFLRSTASCRAVYGEADGIPGLIVDKYERVAVVQILSAAFAMRQDWVVKAVREVLGVSAVFERSDASVRELEGLAPAVGCLYGECPEAVEIKENGLTLVVDLLEGQKTGHFFDQMENRMALEPLVRWSTEEKPRPDQHYNEERAERETGRRGADVLDCFSHTGAFAMHALKYGANSVTLVDYSERALEQAKINAERNGFLERCEFINANAFDYLRSAEKEARRFDVVILDPPAFAKTREAVDQALKGYKEINLRGLKLLKEGGFLVTASCSYHVSSEAWLNTIQAAAVDARKILRLVELRRAGKDHPQLFGMPENDYLKFAVFEVKTRA